MEGHHIANKKIAYLPDERKSVKLFTSLNRRVRGSPTSKFLTLTTSCRSQEVYKVLLHDMPVVIMTASVSYVEGSNIV